MRFRLIADTARCFGLVSLGLAVAAHAGEKRTPVRTSHSARITITSPSDRDESSNGRLDFWLPAGAAANLVFRLHGVDYLYPAERIVASETYEVGGATFGDLVGGLFTGHFSTPSTAQYRETFVDVGVRWGDLADLLHKIAVTKKPKFAAEVSQCLDEMQHVEAECATPHTCQLTWPWSVTPKEKDLVPFLLGQESRIEITCGTGDPFSWKRMYVTLKTDKPRAFEDVPAAVSSTDADTLGKWVAAEVVPPKSAPKRNDQLLSTRTAQ